MGVVGAVGAVGVAIWAQYVESESISALDGQEGTISGFACEVVLAYIRRVMLQVQRRVGC